MNLVLHQSRKSFIAHNRQLVVLFTRNARVEFHRQPVVVLIAEPIDGATNRSSLNVIIDTFLLAMWTSAHSADVYVVTASERLAPSVHIRSYNPYRGHVEVLAARWSSPAGEFVGGAGPFERFATAKSQNVHGASVAVMMDTDFANVFNVSTRSTDGRHDAYVVEGHDVWMAQLVAHSLNASLQVYVPLQDLTDRNYTPEFHRFLRMQAQPVQSFFGPRGHLNVTYLRTLQQLTSPPQRIDLAMGSMNVRTSDQRFLYPHGMLEYYFMVPLLFEDFVSFLDNVEPTLTVFLWWALVAAVSALRYGIRLGEQRLAGGRDGGPGARAYGPDVLFFDSIGLILDVPSSVRCACRSDYIFRATLALAGMVKTASVGVAFYTALASDSDANVMFRTLDDLIASDLDVCAVRANAINFGADTDFRRRLDEQGSALGRVFRFVSRDKIRSMIMDERRRCAYLLDTKTIRMMHTTRDDRPAGLQFRRLQQLFCE